MSNELHGTLIEMTDNIDGVYEGNLRHYAHQIFHQGQHFGNGYHGYRHNHHVTWQCYQACRYYGDGKLDKRSMRNLVVAALWHDFDHSGMAGHDDLNLLRAIRGFHKNIVPEDELHAEAIIKLMWVTEYPYKVLTNDLHLTAQILRDADMSQCFSTAWIETVIIGLAREWRRTPLEVLKGQVPFLRGLKFYTEWGQASFTQAAIDKKIVEVEGLIALYDK